MGPRVAPEVHPVANSTGEHAENPRDPWSQLVLRVAARHPYTSLATFTSQRQPHCTMKFSTLLAGAVALFSSEAIATSLTYRVEAHERACFYANTKNANEKIAFYFAVQSGGSFDIDYEVTSPTNKVIMSGEKERQGDFAFTAQTPGDYSFCFSNQMSTFAEKFVDLEIAVENEDRAQLPSKQGSSPEQTNIIEDSVYKISGQLSTISRNQKYFRTRENRNFATVASTENRIVNFSMIQSFLVVCMGGLQVFVVRFFFQGARKGYV